MAMRQSPRCLTQTDAPAFLSIFIMHPALLQPVILPQILTESAVLSVLGSKHDTMYK